MALGTGAHQGEPKVYIQLSHVTLMAHALDICCDGSPVFVEGTAIML